MQIDNPISLFRASRRPLLRRSIILSSTPSLIPLCLILVYRKAILLSAAPEISIFCWREEGSLYICIYCLEMHLEGPYSSLSYI